MEGRKSDRSIVFCKYSIQLTINKGKTQIEISCLFILILSVMCLADCLEKYLITLASMLLHELGHLAAVKLTGKRIRMFQVLPVGFGMSVENYSKRSDDIVISLSGLMVNLFVFVMCSLTLIVCNLPHTGLMGYFASTNLYLFFFNSIPILPLDGGRFLVNILSNRFGLVAVGKFLSKIAIVSAAGLIMVGIIQIKAYSYNPSLLLIGVYILFYIKSTETEAAIMNVKQILYRRSRLLKKGVYEARDLVVLRSMHVGEILKNMDFDRFHIIHVLDSELKICRTYSEQEIIEAMLNTGSNPTFEELMSKEEKLKGRSS